MQARRRDLPTGMISNRAPNVLHALLVMRYFHEPAGLNDFDDPATWDRASYNHHPCDDFEPLPDICRMGRLLCQAKGGEALVGTPSSDVLTFFGQAFRPPTAP
jgi:hypothetical protein